MEKNVIEMNKCDIRKKNANKKTLHREVLIFLFSRFDNIEIILLTIV